VLPAAISLLICFCVRAESLPTFCPAIEAQDRNRPDLTFGISEPPTLVVLGKAAIRTGESSATGDEPRYLEIEQVLYGHWPRKTLKFSWTREPTERSIFFLAPTRYKDAPDFRLRYTMDPEELQAAKALCAARLVTLALSAQSIFIGEEVGDLASAYRTVKVHRNISGQQFGAGAHLWVAMLAMDLNLPLRPHPAPLIYFVGSPHTRRDIRNNANARTQRGKDYSSDTLWSDSPGRGANNGRESQSDMVTEQDGRSRGRPALG
jgi:hypothetical protein